MTVFGCFFLKFSCAVQRDDAVNIESDCRETLYGHVKLCTGREGGLSHSGHENFAEKIFFSHSVHALHYTVTS